MLSWGRLFFVSDLIWIHLGVRRQSWPPSELLWILGQISKSMCDQHSELSVITENSQPVGINLGWFSFIALLQLHLCNYLWHSGQQEHRRCHSDCLDLKDCHIKFEPLECVLWVILATWFRCTNISWLRIYHFFAYLSLPFQPQVSYIIIEIRIKVDIIYPF